MARPRYLEVPCLRVEQREDMPLYVFGVNGRLIQQFASVSSAERSSDGALSGYQRLAVSPHVSEILRYLSQKSAMLPNSIVVAFSGQLRFDPVPGCLRSQWGVPGTLHVPLPNAGEAKSAFIVDGQQRVSALSQLDPSRQFPVIVTGFASASPELQLEQFVLVNKTKPLPRDLITELLPYVPAASVPSAWQLRRVSSAVLEILRYDSRSPFYGRLRGLGASGEGCNISQAAVLGVVESSLKGNGVLAEYVTNSRVPDFSAMANIVGTFYGAVAEVWPEAWNGSPWSSRLVHGAGIWAVGGLMDLIMAEVDVTRPRALSSVARRLRVIEECCAWTGGRWPQPLDCSWDAPQNTRQDRRLLAEFLKVQYRVRS